MPNKDLKLNELLNEREVKTSPFTDCKGSSEYQSKNSQINKQTGIDDSLVSDKMSSSAHHLVTDNNPAEVSFHEQLQLIKNEKEKEVQKLREKLLEELDRLRSLQLELEHEKNDIRRQRTSIFNDKDLFQEKKLLLEKEFENKFQKELQELEIDFKTQLHLKESEIDNLQKTNLTKGQKLFELEVENRSFKERCNNLEKDLLDQREMFKEIQEKYSLLLEENIELQRNFEGMSDYSIIKDELSMKIRENVELEGKLKAAVKSAETEKQKSSEMLVSIEKKLKLKEPELLQTQKQLNFAKETLHQQESVWDKERKKLEQELQNSKEMYKAVLLRLEEQREDIHDLHKTLHFLQYQISSNLPVTNIKSEASGLQHKHVELMRKGIPDFKSKSKSLGDFSMKYRENSLNFISEAKDRIDRLEKEAEIVKDKYSFIFSNTAQPKTDLRYLDQNSTIPKTIFSSKYNFPTNSFTSNTYSHFPSNYFDNLVKNEMSFLNLKTATNIKRIVSNSQLSNNLFSFNQQNERNKSKSGLATETSADNWKESLNISQKQPLAPLDSFKEKELTSNYNNKKENGDSNSTNYKHLFNFSNSSLKALDDEVPLASLQFDLTSSSGNKINKSLMNFEYEHDDINKTEKISEHLAEMQGMSEPILKKVTLPEASLEKTISEETQNTDIFQDKTMLVEGTESHFSATDLDASLKENTTSSTLPKIEKSMNSENNENSSLKESKDDTIAVNFVVDLDAAWKKRKSSIADLSFNSNNINLDNKRKANDLENEEGETIPLKTPQEDDDNSAQNLTHDTLEFTNQTDDAFPALGINENKTEFITAFGQNNSKMLQNVISNLAEDIADKLSEEESLDVSNKMSIMNDRKTSQNVKKPNKNKSGSNSELSDVQLSCGSEDGAKEEDDFW